MSDTEREMVREIVASLGHVGEIMKVEHDTVELQVLRGVPGLTVWVAWETPDTYDGTFFTPEQWQKFKDQVDLAFKVDEGN